MQIQPKIKSSSVLVIWASVIKRSFSVVKQCIIFTVMTHIFSEMVLYAGRWKKGFSTCCICADLALAGLAQKRVETLQILSVCIRAEAGQRVCEPVSL